MMMQFAIKYKLIIVGVLLGAIGGYAYYYYIGCATGSCAITSNPYRSTAYGMLLGGLFVDLFNSKNKKAGK